MKKYLIIVFSALMMVGCSLPGNAPSAPISGTMTAMVTSYNSAQLTGTVPSGAKVSFTNSSHSSGRVGSGQTAEMLVTGLPQGWITSMTAYVHSNKTSGAGELTLSVGDSAYLHYEGTMKDWIGCYSDTDVPLCTSCAAISYCQEPIRLTLTGTTNSLFLTKLEIIFTTIEPQRDTVYLSYWNTNQPILDTLCEQVAGAGVVLPTCPTITRQDSDWVHVGWTSQAVIDTMEQPHYYPCGNIFHVINNHHLWALYRYSSNQILSQDTTYQSGEYALIRDNGMMARGGWKNKNLNCDTVTLYKDDLYYWHADSVAKENRYYLSFTQDSITIRVLSEDNEWLGHTGNNTNKSKTSWEWKRAAEGSVFIDHDMQEKHISIGQFDSTYMDAYSICFSVDMSTLKYDRVIWKPSTTYWLLFPTSNMPKQPYHRWTTNP